jgi:N utilization substance protein A
LIEATAEVLVKLLENPEYAEDAEELTQTIQQVEAVLVKKGEGRPITPEEYQLLSRFVNRVELGAVDRRHAELDSQREYEAEMRATVPDAAFDIPLDDLGISPRLNILLTGEGYSTIGEFMLQLAMDSDVILALNGIGPKTMEAFRESIAAFEFPEIEVVEPPVEETTEEAEAEVEEESEVEEVVEEEEVQEIEAEDIVEEQIEAVAEVEEEPEAVADVEVEVPAEEVEAVVEEPEPEGIPIKEAFKEKPSIVFVDDDESDEPDDKKKKKKKKAFREVEYDPDLDVTIVRRRRKGDSEDDWEEYLD